MAEEGRRVSVIASLELQGLVLRLRLGVLPVEKISERDVPVDLSWTGPHAGGAPFDYTDVIRTASRFSGACFDLVEDLAEALLGALTAEFPAGTWRVRVRKPWPPVHPPVECVVFTLEGGGYA
jgi:dihydroneopterin aldolase